VSLLAPEPSRVARHLLQDDWSDQAV